MARRGAPADYAHSYSPYTALQPRQAILYARLQLPAEQLNQNNR